MSFSFDNSRLYRMPVHFGPTPGPRQGPDGQAFDWATQPDRTLWCMDFAANRQALEAFLPSGYQLDGEPMVRIELQQWRRLAWLAGRGYNTLGVKVPVRFEGDHDRVRGHFLAVIWENMPDAIISGREELGYNKVFASIADPREHSGTWNSSADWFGHRFIEFSFSDLRDAPPDAGPRTPGDGILSFKYVPGCSADENPDSCYTTLTPIGGRLKVTHLQTAQAHLHFLPTSWEDMPTQHHIVTTLSKLGLGPAQAAWRVESTGARDLSDTRRLR